MFLAPLNYDRFFKKIFSDKRISKRFLEDFFEVTIEEIELVSLDHKLTNESNLLKFDFRCKIDGEYIIIDMQQWYQQDIVQRFYLYHAANSVLQLESLPTLKPTKEKRTKDYSGLLPVKTLIWLVHDNLNVKSDFLIHQMLPTELLDLVQKDEYWTTRGYPDLHRQRAVVLELLENDAKNLTFLRGNQLIFAFQRNIVKNKKLKPYYQWFEFAEKTRNSDNKKADFKQYDRDEIFADMIRKLSHRSLDADELDGLEYFRLWEGRKDVFKRDFLLEGEKMGWQKAKKQIKQAQQEKEQAQQEKEQAVQQAILAMLQNTNLSHAEIAVALNVSIEQVKQAAKKLN